MLNQSKYGNVWARHTEVGNESAPVSTAPQRVGVSHKVGEHWQRAPGREARVLLHKEMLAGNSYTWKETETATFSLPTAPNGL